uniref:MazG domain-containing protein n=1 Tax=Angiostrongylus cantonensis TaxID=6313 RepID=A0A0K0DFX9_ANGCA
MGPDLVRGISSSSISEMVEKYWVDIHTIKKPFRQWNTEEVITFLKDLITDVEAEQLMHNKMTGSRMKDFCCFDFLVHVVRLSECSAIKVLDVLQPYLNEMERVEIPRAEYQYSLEINDCEAMVAAVKLNTELASIPNEDTDRVDDVG